MKMYCTMSIERAREILRGGPWKCNAAIGGAVGVDLSDSASDYGPVTLAVEVPDAVVERYRVVNDGSGGALVPPDVLNEIGGKPEIDRATYYTGSSRAFLLKHIRRWEAVRNTAKVRRMRAAFEFFDEFGWLRNEPAEPVA